MNPATRIAAALVLSLALAACSKVTPENYARLKDGMSEAEVVAILGTPGDASAVAMLGVTGSSSTWTGGEYTIKLQFVNGKVIYRSLGRNDIR